VGWSAGPACGCH